MRSHTVKLVTGLILLLGLTSCSLYNPAIKPSEAKLAYQTAVEHELKLLPPPKEKVVAAVYNFRDQTGQYKVSDNASSWSTAVTQGATSMLIEALESSGWFTVIEREGLSNLLNERKIIRSSRENYSAQNDQRLPSLPPLLYAGVILEGGIISYESNILTGGNGAKYFGLGASEKYRQDRVSIYLRATSTKNGRVLKTVHTTKTILSKMVDVGIYRFVRFKRLLEIETGISYNEPTQMCVLEAIQKAVQSLVIEGIQGGLWALKYPDDMNAIVIQNYLEEKKQAESSRSPLFVPEGTSAMGVNLGGTLYLGDYSNPSPRYGTAIFFREHLTPRIHLISRTGYYSLGALEEFQASVLSLELLTALELLPLQGVKAYIELGGGINSVSTKNHENTLTARQNWVPSAAAGVTIEFPVSDKLGVSLGTSNHYLFYDKVDGREFGNINDHFWDSRAGLHYYWK